MSEQSRDASGRIIRKGPYPELTPTGIIVGYILGILITISIGYACLILGFSIEGSELAAILGFGILRGLLGRSSIVENNINQTIASAVNGASAGLMFSVPALFILKITDFNAPLMVFACMAGGIMGIAFIIPLRKQMIDYERLTFPGGVAVASILKSPGAGIHKALLLLSGMAVSAVVHFVSQYMSQFKHYEQFEKFNFGSMVGMPEYMNSIWLVSLMTIGVGFIAGRAGFCFIIGGFTCYWILAPVLAKMNILPTPEQMAWLGSGDVGAMPQELVPIALKGVKTMPDYLREILFKPIGIGMLVGGAITGIVLAFPLIINAISSMQKAAKTKAAHSEDEMPIKLLYIGIVGAILLLGFVAVKSVSEMGIVRGATMAVLGTLWIWVAGVVLSECIGRTNWSPLSGMTLIAVTILIIIAKGLGDKAAIISSITVGAAACVAMAQATDLMLDLKTGYLVGASPKKQQIGQFLGSLLGPAIVMILIFVLHKAYTIGSSKLEAPQGAALAGMINGILGGNVPVQKYIAGAGLGAVLSASGIGGLGIMVGLGFYLSFSTVLTYSIGTVLRMVSDWKMGIRFSEEAGIPVAAGLIVGEALIGVGFALFKVFQGIMS